MSTKPAKSPKLPAAPWFIATVILPSAKSEGFTPGEKVVVRKSREGGYRILSATRTIVVGDKYIAAWVKREARRDGSAIMLNPAAQKLADERLQAVFKAQWLAAPGVKAA
jgi:hypothetical protein